MRTRVFRWVTGLLLVALMLAAAGYAWLPGLGGWAGARLLERLGAEQAMVQVDHIGLRGARIERVRVRAGGVEVELGPLDLAYRPATLARGKVERVVVGAGRITMARVTGEGEAHLPAGLPPLPLLPFERLAVGKIDVAVGQATVTVTGEAEHEGGRLIAEAMLLHADEPLATIEGRWEAGELALALAHPTAGAAPWARVQARDVADGLAVTAEMNPAMRQLRALLRPWRGLPPELEGEGRLSLDGTLAGRAFNGRYRLEPEFGHGEARLTGMLQGTVAATHSSVTLGVDPDAHLALALPADGTVSLAPLVPLDVILSTAGGAGAPRLSTAGPLQVHYREQRGLVVDAVLRDSEAILQRALRLTANVEVEVAAAPAAVDRIPLSATAKGRLQWRPGQVSAEIGEGAELVLPLPDGGAPAVLTLQGPTAGAWKRNEGWSLEPSQWLGTLPEMRIGNAVITSGPLSLDIVALAGEGQRWAGEGHFEAANLQAGLDGHRLPAGTVAGRIDADSEAVRLDGSLVARGVSVSYGASHAFKEGAGSLSWQARPLHFAPDALSLSELYQPWPYPFDLGAGRLAAAGRIDWSRTAAVSAAVDLKGEGLGGFYGDLLFSGAEGRAALRLNADGELYTVTPALVRVETLTAGVPAREFAGRLEFRYKSGGAPWLRLERPTLKLLGGTASSEQVVLDFGQAVNRFEVQVSGVELDQLLNLEQAPIDGFGKVSGSLPVLLTGEGLAVEDGHVASARGGVIRYQPSEEGEMMAAADQNMKLALTALRDFRYDSLRADADYRIDGRLDLRVRLVGRNPDLFEGRTIEFNINVEENIPDLMRSLRAGQALEGQVEQWLEEFYRRRRNAEP